MIFVFYDIYRRSVSSVSSMQSSVSSKSSIIEQRETKHSQTMTIVEASPKSSKASLSSRLSTESNQVGGDRFTSLDDIDSPWHSIRSSNGKKKSSSSSSIASSILGFGRKHGISLGRRKSSLEEPRNFQYE